MPHTSVTLQCCPLTVYTCSGMHHHCTTAVLTSTFSNGGTRVAMTQIPWYLAHRQRWVTVCITAIFYNAKYVNVYNFTNIVNFQIYLCATKRLQVFLLLNMICLQYTLNGLPSNMRYNLKLAGVTQAIFSKRFLVGEFTPPVTFTLGGWCFTVVS